MNTPFLRALCLGILLWALTTFAFAAKLGGEGILKMHAISQQHCFATNSKIVTRICGLFEIRWKLWSLMGEPIGDFRLVWTLGDMHLQASDGFSRKVYKPGQLPPELLKAAKRTELYVDGLAYLRDQKSSGGYWLPFNTGVAVSSGGVASHNMPGGYDWHKFLVRSYNLPPMSNNKPGTNVTGLGWCDPKGYVYASTADAKRVMIDGVRMEGLQLCPSTAVYVDALESAISKYCESSKNAGAAGLCEKKIAKDEEEKEPSGSNTANQANGRNFLDGPSSSGRQAKSIADVMDADAERPLIHKRLAQEKAVYRGTAAVACQNIMRGVDACYAKTSCKRPVESPSISECKNIPAYPRGRCFPFCLTSVPGPGDVCYREDAECRAARAKAESAKAREEEELERRQSRWESNYGSLSQQCKSRDKEREEFAGCQKQYGPTCNPEGFEGQNACIEHRMSAFGPNEQQARALLKKEWEAKARTKNNAPTGKNSATSTNFLD